MKCSKAAPRMVPGLLVALWALLAASAEAHAGSARGGGSQLRTALASPRHFAISDNKYFNTARGGGHGDQEDKIAELQDKLRQMDSEAHLMERREESMERRMEELDRHAGVQPHQLHQEEEEDADDFAAPAPEPAAGAERDEEGRRTHLEHAFKASDWYDVQEYEQFVQNFQNTFGGLPWPLFIVIVGLFLTCVVVGCSHFDEVNITPDTPRDQLSLYPELKKRPNEDLGEDIYGFAICAVCRDAAKLSGGDHHTRFLRQMRVSLAVLLVYFSIGVQMFIQYQIQKLCINKWVHDIRVVYSDYQTHMCGGEQYTTQTANHYNRCPEEHFDSSRFGSFDNKEAVCNIPFSQPHFTFIVCFIWAMTCIGEVKTIIGLFASLVVRAQTGTSMAGAIVDDDDAEADDDGCRNDQVIHHLTKEIKAFICGGILVPRLMNTAWLLYLGTRWLTATYDFSEMVLNAVGLAFILELKDLLYEVLVPERNKREVRTTELKPPTKYEQASYQAFLGSFGWGCAAAAWVIVYMLVLQRVLPEYHWDVQSHCVNWLRQAVKVL